MSDDLIVCYVNVYDAFLDAYETKEEAEKHRHRSCLRTVKMIEVKENE